jgi:hypothetical protein
MKKNTRKKKRNGLAVLMALSLCAAGFFGFQSYSVDNKLSLPIVGTVITGTQKSAKSSSKTSSTKSSSSSHSSGASATGMMMQMGK